MNDKAKIIANQQNMNLPEKPKILKAKSKQNHSNINNKVINFLAKSSPLNKQYANHHRHQQKTQMISNQNSNIIKKKHKISQKSKQSSSENSNIYFQKTSKLQKQAGIYSQSLFSENNTQRTEELLFQDLNKILAKKQSSIEKGVSNSIQQSSVNQQQSHEKKTGQKKLIKRQHTKPRSMSEQQENYNKKQTISHDFVGHNRFYLFCTNQITTLSDQNYFIKESIKRGQAQYQRLLQSNKQLQLKLENQIKDSEIIFKEKQILENQTQILKKQLKLYQQKIEHQLPTKYKQEYKKRHSEHKQLIVEKYEQIKKQQRQIGELQLRIKRFHRQEEEKHFIFEQNQILKQEIESLILKGKQLKEKIPERSFKIKHLYEVKSVEHENLIKIIGDKINIGNKNVKASAIANDNINNSNRLSSMVDQEESSEKEINFQIQDLQSSNQNQSIDANKQRNAH